MDDNVTLLSDIYYNENDYSYSYLLYNEADKHGLRIVHVPARKAKQSLFIEKEDYTLSGGTICISRNSVSTNETYTKNGSYLFRNEPERVITYQLVDRVNFISDMDNWLDLYFVQHTAEEINQTVNNMNVAYSSNLGCILLNGDLTYGLYKPIGTDYYIGTVSQNADAPGIYTISDNTLGADVSFKFDSFNRKNLLTMEVTSGIDTVFHKITVEEAKPLLLRSEPDECKPDTEEHDYPNCYTDPNGKHKFAYDDKTNKGQLYIGEDTGWLNGDIDMQDSTIRLLTDDDLLIKLTLSDNKIYSPFRSTLVKKER